MPPKDQNALTEGVYYILIALHTPLHGYGIMQFVKEVSDERVNLGPGTLYGAINTMLEKNWIVATATDADTRKKEYVITDVGREVVQTEMKRLEELLENGRKITGVESDEV
ncbi:PadR family transcriptional regulator [Anaerobacillus alkaliphilus]|uniref:PadR family transcriptional regulator n=1 Tax=Anaerobacillus alkaliphilus TaxID=1548597 RepID=A0A4Q0VUL4_9BACI|nr:PadR family transcriptional regulator [Anaerobacillus alkaliphilus]RXJ02426.1 PadR family transcriptional regulator [Anaerobacillus alkaliphilus]